MKATPVIDGWKFVQPSGYCTRSQVQSPKVKDKCKIIIIRICDWCRFRQSRSIRCWANIHPLAGIPVGVSFVFGPLRSSFTHTHITLTLISAFKRWKIKNNFQSNRLVWNVFKKKRINNLNSMFLNVQI